MSKKAFFALTIILLICLGIFRREPPTAAFSFQPLPRLRGVVSDYFRFGFNYEYPTKYGGLDKELERIKLLKKAGAPINLVGLYLGGYGEIKDSVEEMDRYIAYAKANGLYVFLAPAGVGYMESNTEHRDRNGDTYWQSAGENDLTDLTQFLASRYGDEPHVMFYLTAEPNLPEEVWLSKQSALALIVRKYSDNPIIVSTSYYTPYPYLPILPYENVIYSVGGYIRRNDGAPDERTVSGILGEASLRENYPVLVVEFGGNYWPPYSTESDLKEIKDILTALKEGQMSYSMYRLSSAFGDDGLALFDLYNHLTLKGELFVESFKD